MSKDPNKPVFYAYALLDPRRPGPFFYGHWKFSHEPFYIGKGKLGRAWCHVDSALEERNGDFNLHKCRKIRSIILEGSEPLVVIKRNRLIEQEAFDLERLLIHKIGRHNLKTGPLTNLTAGGDGAVGRVMAIWQKDQIRQQVKERMSSLSEAARKDRSYKIGVGVRAANASGRRDPKAIGKKIAATKYNGPKLKKGVSIETQIRMQTWWKRYRSWRQNALRSGQPILLSFMQFLKLAKEAGIRHTSQIGCGKGFFQLIRKSSVGKYSFRECQFVPSEVARLNQTSNGRTRT